MKNVPKEVVNNTLVDYPRLLKIQEELDNTDGLEGDIAEVGVYKGGTALWIALNAAGMSRKIFLFDTFDGMPETAAVDLHQKGDFADTSIQHVDNLLKDSYDYAMYKGIFPRVNSEYVAHRKFSFVHLDVDIYPSVKECLEFFYPRMLKGGVILLDDYNEPNCPGAKLATDEFCVAHGLILEPTCQSQAMIRIVQ